ncbi:MAG: HAMP domain-containing histidine kinase, partial [Clostridia bacterium]|nr:HAMP domain-containing histidine kinase [Clostridia bacterium]
MKKEKNIIGNNIEKVKQKMPMVFYLSVFIFATSCVTAIIAFFLYVIFVNAGFMTEITLIWLVLVLLFGSVVISTSLVRGLGNKIIFGSLRQITRASKAVANGDFSQRLEPPREKEIAELCDSFNEMVNKLGTNELLARDFISNVSHQFRTPIASIHGYAQLLEDDSISTEEKLEYIEVIKEKSISLSNLINDVLELSRLEHLSASIEKELFSIDEQLRKCIISFADRLDEKKIDISLELQTVNYLGCKELLAEVWNNLIENAIKFSTDGGKIVVDLNSNFDNIYISVQDFGICMS